MTKDNTAIQNIGQALFIVNRHAKTAPDPTYLYKLKKEAMKKLLQEQKAIKVGLHFSNNPKHSRQHSVMLVKIGAYYFHMPPSKMEMQQLTHLGKLDGSYRNPKPTLSLRKAKEILTSYLNWPNQRKVEQKKDTPFTQNPTFLSNASPFYHKRKW